ncbi:hypothetical protein BOX15_Mlig027049g3, partial [Macrostomum lignano]
LTKPPSCASYMWPFDSLLEVHYAVHALYCCIICVLAREVYVLRFRIDALRTECSDIEKKNEKLEQRNEVLEKRSDLVGEKNDKLTAENNALTNEKYRLQSENSSLELVKQASDSSYEFLNKRLSKLELKNSQLKAKNNALEKTNSAVEFSVTPPINGQCNASANDVSLREEFETLEKKNQEFRTQIALHEKDRSLFEEKLDNMSLTARDFETKNSELRMEVDRLKDKNKVLKDKLAALRRECSELENNQNALQRKYGNGNGRQTCSVNVTHVGQMVLNTQVPIPLSSPKHNPVASADVQETSADEAAGGSWTDVPRRRRNKRRGLNRLQ